MKIDFNLYQRYLNEYVKEAIQNSNGTNASIAEYLSGKTVRGFLVQHKEERKRALQDAQIAFEEHRHWPLQIVLSHLGVELENSERG